MKLPSSVVVREVGLRDGLQSRPQVVPTAIKAEMMRGLIDAGFRKINAVAFVNPRVTPQMADAEQLLEVVGPVEGACISALIPNARGLERARPLAARGLIHEALLLYATTSGVLKANGLPGDLDKAHADAVALCAQCKQLGLRTVVFVSATFGCSIEGYVDPKIPLAAGEKFRVSGVVDEIVYSDSTGQANPKQVFELFSEVKRRFGPFPITAHFHDTRGAGLANALAVLQVGLEHLTIDSAFAGLGGDIPFLPEAAGNICTEDMISMLDGCGIATGIDLKRVIEVSRLAKAQFPDPLQSRVLEAGPIWWQGSQTRRGVNA